MRRVAVGAYIAVLVLFGLLIARPYLRAQHDTPAEIPSPPPLTTTSLDVLLGGQRLCATDVPMSRQSRQVRFIIGTYFKPGPPLQVTVSAAGYHSSARVNAGWPDNEVHEVALRKPQRDQRAIVCIRNGGKRKIAVYASAANRPARGFLKGQLLGATPELGFYEGRTRSIAANAEVTAGRIATFRGVFGHVWIVWALAFLFVIGMPMLIGVGLWATKTDP